VRRRYLIAIALVLAAAAVVLGISQPLAGHRADSSSTQTVTVTGTGSVDTVPDLALYSFSVDSPAKTATAAYALNGPAAQKLVDAVRGAGVARADIQTTATSLQPQTSDDGRTIVGYVASTSISAKVRELGKVGEVLDAAVGAGATGIDGPSLLSSTQDELYKTALKRAVSQANDKAAVLAGAANLQLGEPQSITEGGSSLVPLAGSAKAPAPSIEPGTTTIEATVTVTYNLG
jgi:uncharacterized protein YggE